MPRLLRFYRLSQTRGPSIPIALAGLGPCLALRVLVRVLRRCLPPAVLQPSGERQQRVDGEGFPGFPEPNGESSSLRFRTTFPLACAPLFFVLSILPSVVLTVDHRADPASSILTPETVSPKHISGPPAIRRQSRLPQRPARTASLSPSSLSIAADPKGKPLRLFALTSSSTFGWSKVSRAFEVFVSSRHLYFQLQSPYLRRRLKALPSSLVMEENEVSTEAVKSEKSRIEVEVSLNNDDEHPLKNLPDACPEPEEGETGVERGSNSESESTLGDVNMEASISTDDVERAGGLGATDDISSFLPVAMDSTDFEASLREAREFEGPQHEISRPGLGWTEPSEIE